MFDITKFTPGPKESREQFNRRICKEVDRCLKIVIAPVKGETAVDHFDRFLEFENGDAKPYLHDPRYGETKFDLSYKKRIGKLENTRRILYENWDDELLKSFEQEKDESLKDWLARVDLDLLVLYNHIHDTRTSIHETDLQRAKRSDRFYKCRSDIQVKIDNAPRQAELDSVAEEERVREAEKQKIREEVERLKKQGKEFVVKYKLFIFVSLVSIFTGWWLVYDLVSEYEGWGRVVTYLFIVIGFTYLISMHLVKLFPEKFNRLYSLLNGAVNSTAIELLMKGIIIVNNSKRN